MLLTLEVAVVHHGMELHLKHPVEQEGEVKDKRLAEQVLQYTEELTD